MHYFFGNINVEAKTFSLSEEESYHCSKVLRIQKGETIGILNGKGIIATGVPEYISQNKCEGTVSVITEYPVPEKEFFLVVAPTKTAERTEWLVEKCTELGISGIYFVKSERGLRNKININRLQSIAIAAHKQSGNPFLIALHDLIDFKIFIEKNILDLKESLVISLDCYKGIKQHLNITNILSLTTEYKKIFIFIGPEGDWHLDEIKILNDKISNTLNVSLGNVRLRTETAAIYVASCCKLINENTTN